MSDPTGGSDLPAGFPLISSPFVEQDSLNITRPWYQFLRQLWLRTGGALTALVSAVEAGVGIATETVNTVVTVSLAAINNGQLLANVTGATGPPSGTDLTALLDQAVGSDPGLILTRGLLVWGPLEPGSAGFALVSQGLGNELEYAQVGTVDELTDGTNLFNDPTTLFFNGFNLTDLGGGEIEIDAPASTFDLIVTDGTNTYNDINTLFFNGANVSNPSLGEAEIDISTSGGGGFNWIATFSGAAVANIDCTGFISPSYDVYKVVISNLLPSSAGANLLVEIGHGVGPTYDTTAGNYEDGAVGVTTGGSNPGWSSSTTQVSRIFASLEVNSQWPADAELDFYGLKSATTRVYWVGDGAYVNNVPQQCFVQIGGDYIAVGAAATALRFIVDAGTFDADIMVYGLKK